MRCLCKCLLLAIINVRTTLGPLAHCTRAPANNAQPSSPLNNAAAVVATGALLCNLTLHEHLKHNQPAECKIAAQSYLISGAPAIY